MSCKCAVYDEDEGFICKVTGDSCMFLVPNSKSCAETFGEGPDAKPSTPKTLNANYTDFSDY